MLKSKHLECAICASQVDEIEDGNLKVLTPVGFPLQGLVGLYYCQVCGFVRNKSLDSQRDFESYYEKINKHTQRPNKDLINLDTGYFQELLEYLSKVPNFCIKDAKILDFGSGANIFSDLCLHLGAKSVVNQDVGTQMPEIKFDLIVSTHCFEHLFNPKEELRILASRLNDDGLMAIAVPDLSRYHACFYGPYNHFDLEHINHFSPASLTLLLNSAGMEVLSLRQSNREVAKGINYSDVLVVAQKSGKHLLKDTHQTPFKPFERKELNSLLNLNYEVYDHLIRDIRSSIKSSEENDENVVFFGLSSYAFRIFHSLHLSGQLEKISGFFDSDTRLHEYSVGPIQIGGLEELIAFQEKQSNKLLKILVAAVKYEGIVEMLNKELGSFNYVVNRV